MAWLDVAGGKLQLRLGLVERRAGFVRGDAQIPLESIRDARPVENPWAELRGHRSPGTRLWTTLAVGSWRFPGGKDFVALHGRGPGIVVELVGLEYARLIVSVEHAEETALEIELAAREVQLFPQRTSGEHRNHSGGK